MRASVADCIIHQTFAPTQAETQVARTILSTYQNAQGKGLGVVSRGSKMIDRAVVNRALKVIAQAEAMGLLK